MFTSRNWRWNLAALALVYAGIFLLLFDRWPLEQAAIKLVGGWMAVAVLGTTVNKSTEERVLQDAGTIFRMLVYTLLALVSWSVAQRAGVFFPDITFESAFTGLLLSSAGMVRSGIVKNPLQLVLSIMLALAGFEAIFSFVNTSSLMTALLAVVSLGLALIGADLAAKSDTILEAD